MSFVTLSIPPAAPASLLRPFLPFVPNGTLRFSPRQARGVAVEARKRAEDHDAVGTREELLDDSLDVQADELQFVSLDRSASGEAVVFVVRGDPVYRCTQRQLFHCRRYVPVPQVIFHAPQDAVGRCTPMTTVQNHVLPQSRLQSRVSADGVADQQMDGGAASGWTSPHSETRLPRRHRSSACCSSRRSASLRSAGLMKSDILLLAHVTHHGQIIINIWIKTNHTNNIQIIHLGDHGKLGANHLANEKFRDSRFPDH